MKKFGKKFNSLNITMDARVNISLSLSVKNKTRSWIYVRSSHQSRDIFSPCHRTKKFNFYLIKLLLHIILVWWTLLLHWLKRLRIVQSDLMKFLPVVEDLTTGNAIILNWRRKFCLFYQFTLVLCFTFTIHLSPCIWIDLLDWNVAEKWNSSIAVGILNCQSI